jgi:AraC-like DNA-binding protein
MAWEPLQNAKYRSRFDINAALSLAGYITTKPTWLDRRVMDCHAIVYILGGGGFYADGRNGERQVTAGDLLVLFPGMVHSYGPRHPGQAWSEAFLVFHGDCFAALERDGLLDRGRPVWSPGLVPPLVQAFDALIAGHRDGAGGDQRLTVARIHLLLAEMALADRQAGAADPLAAAKAGLAARLDEPLDLERLAADAGLGYEAFRKRFAASEGVPPARWRQQRRIERAKALLAESDATLADIAARLGYCDQFFFSRQFKRVAGVTPGAFRASLRGR